MQFNDFKSMRKKKADKPHYIPDKEELLKYSDTRYYEKPKQYDDLMKYIEKNFFYKDPEKAEMLCQNIRWQCIEGINIQQIFNLFNTFEAALSLQNPKIIDFTDSAHISTDVANSEKIYL